MTEYVYSVVGVAPIELVADANLLSTAIGYAPSGAETYVAQSSPTGLAPATHFGFHAAAAQNFVDLLAAADQGQLPAIDWAAHGLTEQRVLDVLSGATFSVRLASESWGAAHYRDVLGQLGLQPVAQTE